MFDRSYQIVVVGFTLTTMALSLATTVSAAPLTDHRTAIIRPVPIRSHRSAAIGVDSATEYTIKDFGAPPVATYSSSAIVAFNDSDEIVGTAQHGRVTECVLYTRRAFISLSPGPSVTSCTPTGMNNYNASTKTATVVGYINEAFAMGAVAFTATASTRSLVSATIFSGNVPSQLNAVNNAGQAIGTMYYAPPGGFNGPPLVYTKGGSKLNIAQPTCTRRQNICTQNLVFTSCPFAGCDFDDKGDVETVPFFGGNIVDDILNITTGSCCTVLSQYYATGPSLISDYGNTEGAMVDNGYFDLTVNDMDIGQPDQSQELQDCVTNPISFSNKGNILVVTNCYSAGEDWTWDPINNFVNIADTLPPNAYQQIVPLGVNDEGHILVELYPSSGPIHWGVLVPPATSNAAATRRARSGRTRMKALEMHGKAETSSHHI